MDELIPHIFERAHFLLQQEVNGTDAQVLQTDIKRAYLNFIVTLMTTGFSTILISSREFRFDSWTRYQWTS